jgi:Mg2+ and Co2+ transporter CorA
MNSNLDLEVFINDPTVVSIALVVLVAVTSLKGMALWRAGRNNQKGWFVVLLVVNTLGLLEILYLIFSRKKKD